MKVALDANILVSAPIRAGKPRELTERTFLKDGQEEGSGGPVQEHSGGVLEVTEDPRISTLTGTA